MTLRIKCQHNLIRIHGQEIVLLRNSSETASKVDVGWWEPETSIEEMASGDRGEFPRQHSAQETVTFPTKILRGLLGHSFVHEQRALQAVGSLEEVFYRQYSQNALLNIRDCRATLLALHQFVWSYRGTENELIFPNTESQILSFCKGLGGIRNYAQDSKKLYSFIC